MKGLLLFIKNNRIIYKASIVSILILMLISVMQINPNNENKTISGTISNADYTICFDASNGKFSIVGKSESDVYDVDKIIKELEISAYPGGVMGEGVNPADYELIFSGVNFSTTAPIALEIKNGDVNIWIFGNNNKISSSYSAEGNGFYGITTTGKITFYGDSSSKLEVNAYNWDENGNKDCAAIAAQNVNIQGATVVANGHGCNGKGIYAERSITIASAEVEAYGGDKAIGVNAVDKLILNKAGDMSTELIEGSTKYEYTPSDIIDYPSIDSLALYKYIKIGGVPTYYYRYTNKQLYKVSKDSTKPLDSTTWPTGCSVTEDGKLVLNGFNFVTTANKVIDIVGEANVLVSGTNTIRNVCNTVDTSYGIYSNSKINITTSTEGGTLDVKGGKSAIADDTSYGIYSDSIINITSTEGTLDVKGGKSAIAVHSTGSCNVNGCVSASTEVDEELLYIKDSEFNTQCMKYKHVKIKPKVISVDIRWGDMDFKYSESDWNASSHGYDKKWSNNTQDGDKITVVNNSNVPVTASIAYSQNSNYEGITGTILQSKAPAAEYKNNTTVIVGRSINAYLSLKGNLSSSTEPETTIGKVTVTISE